MSGRRGIRKGEWVVERGRFSRLFISAVGSSSLLRMRRRKEIETYSCSPIPFHNASNLEFSFFFPFFTLTVQRTLYTNTTMLLERSSFRSENDRHTCDETQGVEADEGRSAVYERSTDNEKTESKEGVMTAQGEKTQEEIHDEALIRVLREAVGIPSTEDIKSMIMGAKNAKEVQYILDHIVYRHHLAADPLNGHGYRVAILQALTAVSPRTICLSAWWDAVQRFRPLGFLLTRSFVAEGFTTIRHWLTQQFDLHGRSPHLVIDGIRYIRELLYWCKEDKLVLDHVMYTRIIFLLTMIVSFMDRHNLYRSSFSSGDFVKRDGIVVEWVLSTERCVDFDEAVLQCDAFLEDVLAMLREDITSRPTFNIFYRLIDYYFATDNVEKMLTIMEEAEEAGVPVAESSTAKLMQLSCALNQPATPALFLRWRVALPQCLIATPDMSRLLFFFARAGGGYPCPVCGEQYNHRNVSVYVWLETPPHQRNCPALQMGRKRKGELEECRILPQNKDWSKEAWGLWNLSAARSIEWGAVEWRGFLLCCMFGSSAAAITMGYPPPLEAKALLDRHLPLERMDDFLRATYMRFLRHHQPHLGVETMRHWLSLGTFRMSPIALQEALMCAACILTSEELDILRTLLKEEEEEGKAESGEEKCKKSAIQSIFGEFADSELATATPSASETSSTDEAPLSIALQGYFDPIQKGRMRGTQKLVRKGICSTLLSLGAVELREDSCLRTSTDPCSWSRRYTDLQFIWKAIQDKDTYVMPFTKRLLKARKAVLQEIWRKRIQLWEKHEFKNIEKINTKQRSEGEGSERKPDEVHFKAEQTLLETIITMKPRNISLLDMKDSASDFAVGSTKKNVFIPS